MERRYHCGQLWETLAQVGKWQEHLNSPIYYRQRVGGATCGWWAAQDTGHTGEDAPNDDEPDEGDVLRLRTQREVQFGQNHMLLLISCFLHVLEPIPPPSP